MTAEAGTLAGFSFRVHFEGIVVKFVLEVVASHNREFNSPNGFILTVLPKPAARLFANAGLGRDRRLGWSRHCGVCGSGSSFKCGDGV